MWLICAIDSSECISCAVCHSQRTSIQSWRTVIHVKSNQLSKPLVFLQSKSVRLVGHSNYAILSWISSKIFPSFRKVQFVNPSPIRIKLLKPRMVTLRIPSSIEINSSKPISQSFQLFLEDIILRDGMGLKIADECCILKIDITDPWSF